MPFAVRLAVRLIGATALAATATALFASPAAAGSPNGGRSGNAVFVQTDDPGGNAVVAYSRAGDGALTWRATYATGGAGGVLDGSVVDHLASQGSLRVDHGLLYVVNAGSNSITTFAVQGTSLGWRHTIGSGGAFPVSIAVHGNVVYVLNARGGGSVQGFIRIGDQLVRVPWWHRTLGLDPTATPEFTNTPGQVAFTPDGSKLLVTTKANTNAVDVFRLDRFGGLSAAPVITTLPGAVPFAVTFDRFDHLVLAEAGTNAVATFVVRADGTLRALGSTGTGQAATCWVVARGDDVYLSNAGSANLSGYRVAHDGSTTSLGTTATDAGTVDAAVTPDGRFLYVQTGASGNLDSFRINQDGSLTSTGSITVPDATGADGIAAA
jgi:6-phosphogluconolactonase (cycloisomerase 2 family)